MSVSCIYVDTNESGINTVSLYFHYSHYLTLCWLSNSSTFQTTSRRPCRV